jgi:hypothetical protein
LQKISYLGVTRKILKQERVTLQRVRKLLQEVVGLSGKESSMSGFKNVSKCLRTHFTFQYQKWKNANKD